MRILLWHGYLLTGSGSNVYTANIARSWRAAGHDVLLLCQERHAADIPFVDEVGDFEADNSRFSTTPTGAAPVEGSCRVVRPAIGEILPLYVYDEYEGFTAKLYVDLGEEELREYVDRNVASLVSAIEGFQPDAIVTGHEVMGPYIAKLACKRTGTSYLAKLHGSGLEYAVKLQDRYRAYASEGLGAAHTVVGGSAYMVAEAASVVPGWIDRAAIVNPGCDVELFKPAERSEPSLPQVAYVGKLIASKGVHDFIAALGFTRSRDLEVTIVGYGGFDEGLRELAHAFETGDRAVAGRIAEEGENGRLDRLADLLDSDAADDAFWARHAQVHCHFTGRLEHGPLSRALPTFDVLVVPSVVPEAFGMVAAEAAACAVLPVVPNHSGIEEAGRAIEEAIGEPNLLVFDARDPSRSLAGRVDAVLDIPFPERRSMGHAACELARARWSWDHVAARLLELALGR